VLTAQPVLTCVVTATAGAAQVALVLPRLARPTPGRRLRIEAQVGQDLLDDRSLQDGRNDLELPGAAVLAVLHVDVEDAREQPRSFHQLACLKPDLGD